MTENQPSVMSVALKYGFITALVGVVYTLILMVSDLGDNRWLSGLAYIILIVGVVLAMKQFKALNFGYMSYGQGLGIGTIVSAVFGFLSGTFTWIYTSFVDTGYMERLMLKQEAAMLEQGMSQEQVDAGMEVANKLQGPLLMIVGATIGAIIMGFLLSLIVSAIMKNNRPEFE
jgi:hypothetical protein